MTKRHLLHWLHALCDGLGDDGQGAERVTCIPCLWEAMRRGVDARTRLEALRDGRG